MQKETGLLSVLPQPENEKSSEASSVFKFSSKLIPTAAKTAIASKSKTEATDKSKSSKTNDDDEDIGSDFFSLSKDNASEELSVEIDIDLPVIKSDKPVKHFPQPHPLLALNRSNDDANSLTEPEETDNSLTLQDLDEDVVRQCFCELEDIIINLKGKDGLFKNLHVSISPRPRSLLRTSYITKNKFIYTCTLNIF